MSHLSSQKIEGRSEVLEGVIISNEEYLHQLIEDFKEHMNFQSGVQILTAKGKF